MAGVWRKDWRGGWEVVAELRRERMVSWTKVGTVRETEMGGFEAFK